jgi:hypothetical protein
MRPINTGDPIDLQEREHVSQWRQADYEMAGRMSSIHHACVVAGVANPGEQCEISQFADSEYIALRALFRVLHALTSQQHPRDPYPKPTKTVQRLLDQRLGCKATSATNDGFVPTRSLARPRAPHRARRSPGCRRASVRSGLHA